MAYPECPSHYDSLARVTIIMSGPGLSVKRIRSILVVTLLVASPLVGQGVEVRDPMGGYLRLLQLGGAVDGPSMMVLPLFSPAVATAGVVGSGPWGDGPAILRLLAREGQSVAWDVETRLFYNSGYPSWENDGSVWRGRGLTAAFDAGGSMRWKGLEVRLRPSVRWAANSAFALAANDLPGAYEWAYPWRPIDLPQRFGPDAFWTADLGQSEIRLDAGPLALGVSAREAWWGPGKENAIVLGNAAGGVPRGFVGSSRPLDAGLARVEWQWTVGRLKRSDWFAPGTPDPGRYLTGWVVTVSPDAVLGLHVGGALVSYGRMPEGGLSVADYLSALLPQDTSTADNLGSVFFRWVLPESDFEVYAEWARNDRPSGFDDFVFEPEHSQGYTLGLVKLFAWGPERRVAVATELTHLAMEGTSRLRDNPTFYAHSVALEGYTHNGQPLGAAVGPGGIQQYLSATVYHPGGRAELWVRRRVRDNDAFYAWADTTTFDGCLYCQHDVSFTVGADVLVVHRSVETAWSGSLTRQRNRWFSGPDVWNVALAMSLRASGGRGGRDR